jgi:hypothetical protein
MLLGNAFDDAFRPTLEAKGSKAIDLVKVD